MRVSDRNEMAAAIVSPHFDAVRDVFLEHDGGRLAKISKTRLVVDPEIRNSERHYAATTEDGITIMVAPEIVELEEDSLIAILAHELGHATDFLYPGRWITRPEGPGKALWVENAEGYEARMWRKLWNQRNADQIEWAADGIAQAVTGRKITYCGPCLIQCFRRGLERPMGLR